MTDKEVDRLVIKLEKYGNEIASSKEKSREFLVNAGILTKKGKFTKPYKNLCILQEQGSH